MGLFDWWISWRNDPTRDLDPDLQNYLKENAPQRQTKTNAEPKGSYRSQLGINDNPQLKSPSASNDASSQTDRPLPSESLFPDGRYSHLWKTYKSPEELYMMGSSDKEKLNDILADYRDKRAQCGRTALENCAEEKWELFECFRSGSLHSMTTMCRDENRKLNRCVEMQTRFLRALGYMAITDVKSEEAEKIQMHADRLYHQMLRQEQLLKEAREKGDTNPSYTVVDPSGAEIMKPNIRGPALQTWDDLPEELKQKLLEKRFKGLEGPALEIAKLEVNQDIAFHQEFIQNYNDRWMVEKKERDKRREEGNERFTDIIKRHLDMRKYPDEDEPQTKSAPQKRDGGKSG